MSITLTLRDAVVDDLGDINGAGIFVTDLTAGTIATVPTPDSMLSLPAAEVRPGEGGTTEDPETLGCTDGMSEQDIIVELHVRSTTPYDAIANLVDDVRNAIERAGGNVRTVTGVFFARVAAWEIKHLAEDHANQRGRATITVHVKYEYDAGSV